MCDGSEIGLEHGDRLARDAGGATRTFGGRCVALVGRDVCYLAAVPMNNSKTTKQTVAPQDLDAATLTHLNVLIRQRARMARALLKRRRKKAGQ